MEYNYKGIPVEVLGRDREGTGGGGIAAVYHQVWQHQHPPTSSLIHLVHEWENSITVSFTNFHLIPLIIINKKSGK